jgi:hypothetical protein
MDEYEMQKEYDFRGGVRGKHYKALASGYTLEVRAPDGTISRQEIKPGESAIILESDVREYFPTSYAVHTALRSLIKLMNQMAESQGKSQPMASQFVVS